MKPALVIGGGFAGCAASLQLQLMGGWDVTLVERAPFLGAGVLRADRYHEPVALLLNTLDGVFLAKSLSKN
jgi:2-polyprenyl-6-methoxyphenol hydroxylase-like FAD-dependent oxidoreductase